MNKRSSIGVKVAKAPITEALDVNPADEKGMIVAVRIRPLSQKEIDSGVQTCCQVLDKSNIVTISQAGVAGSYLKSQLGTINEYAFDAVFDSSASQMAVYERTAKPMIPKVLAGFNVTVFAYGATSAGKTHTMFGSSRADEASSNAEAGIIPNAINDVFHLLEKKKLSSATGEKWEVKISYLEVYNEQLVDLLVLVPTGKFLSLR
jgi:kinesin family protein 18/19